MNGIETLPTDNFILEYTKLCLWCQDTVLTANDL